MSHLLGSGDLVSSSHRCTSRATTSFISVSLCPCRCGCVVVGWRTSPAPGWDTSTGSTSPTRSLEESVWLRWVSVVDTGICWGENFFISFPEVSSLGSCAKVRLSNVWDLFHFCTFSIFELVFQHVYEPPVFPDMIPSFFIPFAPHVCERCFPLACSRTLFLMHDSASVWHLALFGSAEYVIKPIGLCCCPTALTINPEWRCSEC